MMNLIFLVDNSIQISNIFTPIDFEATFNVVDIIDFNIDANSHCFYLKLIQVTEYTDKISDVTNNGSSNKTIS